MEGKLKEELGKHYGIADKFARRNGLILDTDVDGDIVLKKKFSEDNIAWVVDIRFVEDHYIAVNIYDKKLIDDVNTEIAKPIIRTADDVILINRDIKDEKFSGLIIYDTRKRRHR